MSEQTETKTIVIYRPWWYRGKGGDDSKMLLNPLLTDGIPKMCCLGQLSIACGLEPSQIEGIAEPAGMEGDTYKDLPQSLHPSPGRIEALVENRAVMEIIAINDSADSMSEADREISLKDKFAAVGIKVEFSDELPEYLAQAFPGKH